MLQVGRDVEVQSQMPSAVSYQRGNSKNYTHDECSALVSEMVVLLDVGPAIKELNAKSIAAQIINSMERMFNISAFYNSDLQCVEHDIAEKIKIVLHDVPRDIIHVRKTILKLCRRIIATIQSYQSKLSTEIILALNRIETLIEEKIVMERDVQHGQPTNHCLYEPKPLREAAPIQNYQTQYGYIRNIKLSITRNINASAGYTKATNTNKDIMHGKYLEVITVDPKPVESIAQLELVFEDVLNRLKMEASMYGQKCELDEIRALIKSAKKSNSITQEASVKLEKVLRPAEKVHIIYMDTDYMGERYMASRAKEAFAIGAQLFLLPVQQADRPVDTICSGVELINSLLDKDVHPDKIVMLSRGPAVHTANSIKDLFSKQGIDITHISFRTEFNMSSESCICTHRTLNISNSNLYTKKAAKNLDCPEEYKTVAAFISKQLRAMNYEPLSTSLVDVHLKSCSLAQLINLFLKTSQHFIQSNSKYANPSLPLERVRVVT